VTILIVAAFAQAFWFLGPPRSLSDDGTSVPVVDCFSDLSDEDYYNGGWMCRLKDSYFHSFSMVFTGDWSFLDKATGAHSTLMIFFAFTIGIFLLNIIIALISNVFTEVEQNGQRAFWLKRLRFISELQSLNALRDFPKKLRNLGDKEEDDNSDDHDVIDPVIPTVLMVLIEILDDPRLVWVGRSLCIFFIILLTPIVLVLGLFTGGYYWPKEMKVYLFFGEIDAASPLENYLEETKEELKRTQEELKKFRDQD
jgi:hypothetical protein